MYDLIRKCKSLLKITGQGELGHLKVFLSYVLFIKDTRDCTGVCVIGCVMTVLLEYISRHIL